MRVVEEGRRLSESCIWDLQRAFYERRGEDAWASGDVPSWATSNAQVAAAWARVVRGFIRDVGRGGPVHVVEIGSGSGRFASHFVRALLALAPEARFKYVMTDFTESNLRAWRARPELAELVDRGVLDFGLFDAERSRRIRLEVGGEVLAPGRAARPMAVIANYVFDSLKQDAFRVEEGHLTEGRAIVWSDRAREVDLADPRIVERLNLAFLHEDAPARVYDDPALESVLAEYRKGLTQASFLMPVGAVRCIEALSAIARRDLLVCCADKAHVSLEDLEGQADESPVVHGTFSWMANLDALARWVRARGGEPLLAPSRDADLQYAAFLVGRRGAHSETQRAFDQHISRLSPFDVYELRALAPASSTRLRDAVLALRLAAYDAQVLAERSEDILAGIEKAGEPLRWELMHALRRVWASYYPTGRGARDALVPFELGRIFMGLERYAEAAAFFERSLALFGDEPAALYNAAMCRYHAGELGPAAALMERALALTPDDPETRYWVLRIRSEAQAERPSPDTKR